jgi:hypothetical protein
MRQLALEGRVGDAEQGAVQVEDDGANHLESGFGDRNLGEETVRRIAGGAAPRIQSPNRTAAIRRPL